MSNDYLQADVAQSYKHLPKNIDALLCYPLLLRALQITPEQPYHLLDYGCGPGEVARRFCGDFAHLRITAVDEAAEMIRIARATHSHEHITYRTIQKNTLPFLPDHSLDAAMALFVLINVSSQQHLRHILQEVFRVLKPNAPFVVLDAHPDGLGKRFLDYQAGTPGKGYQPGEAYPVQLFSSGEPLMQVTNYYWPKEIYFTLFAQAGFSQIKSQEPTLKELSEEERVPFEAHFGSCHTFTEWEVPPYLIVRGVKPAVSA
ncbi:methyltransferase UbiE [Reticulibacter mediterranei]|uniref:Methyltransferase UbiE n=1 Tax=Reticulibacter mediterranei TaxID=2778369 RepID=A0A8J3N2W7_9CHLR|nr:class I SAM-dependent methyltransferase [Reticulibacter mediterranei]GHO96504.1 methyltransferase UbiE [Reticulibacter mediterranei]